MTNEPNLTLINGKLQESVQSIVFRMLRYLEPIGTNIPTLLETPLAEAVRSHRDWSVEYIGSIRVFRAHLRTALAGRRRYPDEPDCSKANATVDPSYQYEIVDTDVLLPSLIGSKDPEIPFPSFYRKVPLLVIEASHFIYAKAQTHIHSLMLHREAKMNLTTLFVSPGFTDMGSRGWDPDWREFMRDKSHVSEVDLLGVKDMEEKIRKLNGYVPAFPKSVPKEAKP